MGTRADFYVGRGEDAEWIGSIAWDGYPSGIHPAVLEAPSEFQYRQAVAAFFDERDDVTLPEDGWPWPWETSATTDYAYAYDDGQVWYSIGYPVDYWWEADEPEPDWDEIDKSGLEPCIFPDMSSRKNVRFDGGSGLMIFRKS